MRADFGRVTKFLRHDVHGALQSLFRCRNALFLADKCHGIPQRIPALFLFEDFGKLPESLCPCLAGTGLTLRTVGTVQIFHLHKRLRRKNALFEVFGQKTLLLN